jgi:RIO kinase 1
MTDVDNGVKSESAQNHSSAASADATANQLAEQEQDEYYEEEGAEHYNDSDEDYYSNEEYDEEGEYFSLEFNPVGSKSDRINSTTVMKSLNSSAHTNLPTNSSQTKYSEPKAAELSKFHSKIYLGDHAKYSQSIANSVARTENQQLRNTIRVKDKADRATTELVLDPRTKLMLMKLINNNTVSAIHGCVSTGKEANVYYAPGPKLLPNNTNKDSNSNSNSATELKTAQPPTESKPSAVAAVAAVASPFPDVAIKIFKTSILVFKDRDKYVSGEYRFRHGYCKSNPRKMVKVWAEKEMRNLKRLQLADIPSPAPVLLKNHVLLMSFIGENGVAAPRLKDARLTVEQMQLGYAQLIQIMRRMFQSCRLVHADLSEYNILYHKNSLYIIDVSQSVEHEHPHAMDFLRKDIENVNKFFRTGGVSVMKDSQLFTYILREFSNQEEENNYLSALQEAVDNEAVDPSGQNSSNNAVEEAVFAQSYIPRSLHEIIDYEREFAKTQAHSDTTSAYQMALRNMAIHPDQHKIDQEFLQKQSKGEEKAHLSSSAQKKSKISTAAIQPTASNSNNKIAAKQNKAKASASESGEESESDEESEDSASESESSDIHEDSSAAEENPPDCSADAAVAETAAMSPEELKAAKKAAKKAVKTANSERRKNKVKKKDKKKKIKATKRNK